jgi:LPXTG-motif cell wall-anchored protein
MRRLGTQLRGEAPWNEPPGQGRLEQALLAGYVVIAVIAVITAATATMEKGLSRVAKQTAQSVPHEWGSMLVELLSASTDFMAAAGLLAIAGLILYRRRRRKAPAVAAPAETLARFGPPFLL